MTSVFSKIISGELPAHFVWKDPEVVAFLSIAPLTAGHTLVVPREEIDQWTDMDGALLSRCVAVAHSIGQGVKRAFDAPRAGMIIAGFEVPHMHVHVAPVWGLEDFDFGRVKQADQAELADAARKLRAAMSGLGFTEAD